MRSSRQRGRWASFLATCAAASFGAAFSAAALANPNLDAVGWLNRIQQAAQKLNFSGTFVYLQQGGQPQTSRVTHVNDNGVERERVEALDGLPIVVMRQGDETRTFSPESKTVLIEKRPGATNFPALPTAQNQLSSLPENYNIRKWDTQRIAGQDCQVLLIEPKDGMRYAHKLWADMATGLLLKAQVFNEKGDIVEQIAFTQVEIGGPAEKYLPRLAKRDAGRDWRTVTALVSETSFERHGWKIEAPGPGFRKVSETKRGQGDGEFGQVVFSDGLTSVSVFLAPLKPQEKHKEGLISQGAVNIFKRRVGEHLVTVLGEAPPACVSKIGKSIEFKPNR